MIPAVHNFKHLAKTDDIIRWLHPILSPELEAASTFEARLATLFTIKEKWTLVELTAMLKDTLEPEQSLGPMLQRNARSLKEQNPFTQGKMTTFYIKKF